MQTTKPDFTDVYLTLASGGDVETFEGAAEFWSKSSEELDQIGVDWLVSEYDFDADWTNWEMHPNGDEVVYLLAGDIDFLLELDGVVETIELRGRGFVIVPRGVWHTAKILRPSRVLALTRGAGTTHKPVAK